MFLLTWVRKGQKTEIRITIFFVNFFRRSHSGRKKKVRMPLLGKSQICEIVLSGCENVFDSKF